MSYCKSRCCRWSRLVALLLAVTVSAMARANEKELPRERREERRFVNPQGLWTPRGFTHVVVAGPGKTVFVAGQVAYDGSAKVVGKGDLRAQTKQVYENLKIALAAAGATFADVVRSTTYVVGFKKEDLDVIRDVRNSYLPPQHPPASTLVGVAALANPDCLIEIEVTAVVE